MQLLDLSVVMLTALANAIQSKGDHTLKRAETGTILRLPEF
jgi:hypothetical protein